MGQAVIDTDAMRLRMTQLEYKGLSEEEYKKDIKRIYLEETGDKFPAEIEVYSTSNPNHFTEDDSGYEGTVIYIYSEEENISEMYVNSQGSQTAKDWQYNLEGIFAGQDISQAKATIRFVNEAKRNFEVSDSTDVIGFSHSLAHNNNVTAQLVYDTFDDIYSVNGAQTNYYQIFSRNNAFKNEVKKEFSITLDEEIYDIDPAKLKAFAEEYFAEKGENIHQIINENDPLYGVSGTRGFFELGDVNIIESDSEDSGIRDIMDGLLDDEVKELQALVIRFSKATADGDINAGIQELTGVNLDFLQRLQDETISTYFGSGEELDQMVEEMDEKVPDLLDLVKKVTTNGDDIFQKFVDAGYIDSDQKDFIVKEIANIEGELEEIEKQISLWRQMRQPSPSSNGLSYLLGTDLGAKFALEGQINAISKSLDKLNRDDLRKVLSLIISDHQIQTVLNMLSNGSNRSYENGDMILTGSNEIKVNMSAALRMYDKGQSLLEDKEDEIKKLETAVEQEIKDYYQSKKRAVQRQIVDIETNPKTYSFLLTKHLPTIGVNKTVKRIRVDEEFESLKHADMDGYIDKLNESVEKGRSYIESYRQSIEALFDEEENISAMFDLAEEGLN